MMHRSFSAVAVQRVHNPGTSTQGLYRYLVKIWVVCHSPHELLRDSEDLKKTSYYIGKLPAATGKY
eukprot:scaffold5152_cov60-Attheya_sp.AAC.6